MYLLDTDVVSALRRIDLADARLVAWARSARRSAHYLSVVTILEIEKGMLQIGRRDPTQEQMLRDWLETRVMPRYGRRILPIDLAVARMCARLHVPDPRPDRDALIAATALVHGFTVVTRNTRDFAPMGVPLLDPWNIA